MKSPLVLYALVAVCFGAAVREKRGWSGSWDGGLVYTSDWSAPGGRSAPAQKLIAVKKVVNVQHQVSVPQVISEPRVVTVMKLVSTIYYEQARAYSPGWSAGWW